MPGPSSQAAKAQRGVGDSLIPRSAVPLVPPAEQRIIAAEALAAAAGAAAANYDDVVEIDPAAVTLSRRDAARLRTSGEIKKFDFYSASKVN